MRGRNLALILAAVMFLVSLPAAMRFSLDWKLDRMFPPGEPLVESYHRLEKRFGGNEIVLAVYRDPQLWSEDGSGLNRLTKVSERLAKVPGVRGVLSLSELHTILDTLQSPLNILTTKSPSDDTQKPSLLDPDNKLAQAFAKVFEGYTHLPGQKTVAVACMLEPLGDARSNHRETILQLREIMSDLQEPASDGFVTGEPVMVTDGFVMVEQDGWRLGVISTALLAAVLFFVFRSLRWTLIPLCVVHWSIIVTQALLAIANLELTMVSSMLTAIITVVGVATTMHILLGYQQLRTAGVESEAAMQQTMTALRAPVAWACITDAVGFLSLSIAEVGPVRDFGIMMAVGSLIVLLAILLLVPGLALLGSKDRDPKVPPFDFMLRVLLRKILFEVTERRKQFIAALVVLAIFGVWGSLRMRVETDFTKNFRASSPLVRGYQTVEGELGGAGVWDIMLPAPPSITTEYLDSVLALEERLRSLNTHSDGGGLQLTKVMSIADADAAAKSQPLLAALPVTARLNGMRTAMPVFTQALLTWSGDEGRWLRIMLRSREQATAQEKSKLVELVSHEVNEFTNSASWKGHFSEAPPAPEVTGYYVMLGRLIGSILSDQWKCFLLSTIGILIVMTIATRSLRLALAALVPNILPVFVVLGAMGWMGMSINMGAAMIASVSMGLSIDSSIHYMLHMRRQMQTGRPAIKAMRSAQENVGLALVLATAALIAGFLSLCVSQFVPTIVFGILVSLTMLGGLIGNLIVLPLLIPTK